MLTILSYTIPLLFIITSIVISPWFNIWKSALSDLGHAVKSNAAPLFNLGLVTSGFLIILNTTLFLIKYSKKRSFSLIYTGYTLILVSVYDEVYGVIHTIVSIMFFNGLIIYLITYSMDYRTIKPLLLLILSLTTWTIHIVLKTPPGAAIPELLTILTTIPFYSIDFIKTNRDTFKTIF